MPIHVGKGVTAYTPSEELTPEDLEVVEKILGATGTALRLEREELIDCATAISGSGPAYVFFFIESLLAAAENLGFSQSEARLLVEGTFEGALAQWKESGLPPETLRSLVTSKGGTTAAAIKRFEEEGVGRAIQSGAKAAKERAVELGRVIS